VLGRQRAGKPLKTYATSLFFFFFVCFFFVFFLGGGGGVAVAYYANHPPVACPTTSPTVSGSTGGVTTDMLAFVLTCNGGLACSAGCSRSGRQWRSYAESMTSSCDQGVVRRIRGAQKPRGYFSPIHDRCSTAGHRMERLGRLVRTRCRRRRSVPSGRSPLCTTGPMLRDDAGQLARDCGWTESSPSTL